MTKHKLWTIAAAVGVLVSLLALITQGLGAVAAESGPQGVVYLTNGSQATYNSPLSEASLPTGLLPGRINITLDTSQMSSRTIEGFGADLTGSSVANLMKLSSTTLKTVMNSLFSPQTGAGISLIRISMGANDFSPQGDYTYDDPPASDTTAEKKRFTDPHLFRFSIASDNNVIKLLKQAEAINPKIQVIASPWTAPPWMKTGNDGKNDAYFGKQGGTLIKSDYSVYASYFVKFIQAYAANGITINYVTPQNEPGNATTNYPGMTLSAQDESDFVSDLSQAFSVAYPPVSTQILDYDWNWNNNNINCTNTCWTNTSTQLPTNSSHLPTALSGASSDVAGIAWHCYGNKKLNEQGNASAQTDPVLYPFDSIRSLQPRIVLVNNRGPIENFYY